MSERGRLQDVIHDELDRQGVRADADGIIDAILNVRDFFPLLLGAGRAVQDDGLDVERVAEVLHSMFYANREMTDEDRANATMFVNRYRRAASPVNASGDER